MRLALIEPMKIPNFAAVLFQWQNEVSSDSFATGVPFQWQNEVSCDSFYHNSTPPLIELIHRMLAMEKPEYTCPHISNNLILSLISLLTIAA
jgi:hypothetical protein